MTDSEATTIYNNYNDSPYYSDYSGASDSDKYTRRHTSVSDYFTCLLYTSPSPRDLSTSRMPSSA